MGLIRYAMAELACDEDGCLTVFGGRRDETPTEMMAAARTNLWKVPPAPALADQGPATVLCPRHRVERQVRLLAEGRTVVPVDVGQGAADQVHTVSRVYQVDRDQSWWAECTTGDGHLVALPVTSWRLTDRTGVVRTRKLLTRGDLRVHQTTPTRLYVHLGEGQQVTAEHEGTGPETWAWLLVCQVCAERRTVFGPSSRIRSEIALLNHAEAHLELDPEGPPPESTYGWGSESDG